MTTNEKIILALQGMMNEGHPLTMLEEENLFLWDEHFETALSDIGCIIETIEVPSVSYKAHYLKETYTNYHTGLRIEEQGDEIFVGI